MSQPVDVLARDLERMLEHLVMTHHQLPSLTPQLLAALPCSHPGSVDPVNGLSLAEIVATEPAGTNRITTRGLAS